MRRYVNFAKGTLTNSPSTAGTSWTSAEFATLPTLAAGETLTLILDPLEETGAPEIVTVTAHSAASTTVTVTRAQESTTARNAASGMRWISGLTAGDVQNDYARAHLAKSHSTTQSLTSATATNLVFDTTDRDIDGGTGGIDIVSTSLFSPAVDGLYLVTAQVEFASVAAVNRRLLVIYNNTDAVNEIQVSVGSINGSNTNLNISYAYRLLAAKDYAIRARQDSGAALNVNAGSSFSVTYLAPAS